MRSNKPKQSMTGSQGSTKHLNLTFFLAFFATRASNSSAINPLRSCAYHRNNPGDTFYNSPFSSLSQAEEAVREPRPTFSHHWLLSTCHCSGYEGHLATVRELNQRETSSSSCHQRDHYPGRGFGSPPALPLCTSPRPRHTPAALRSTFSGLLH